MKTALLIALRYLFSKKKHNIINVISSIAVSGITVGTASLIIVLSVFNGFEDLVVSMFNSINPDLLVTPKEGKTFELDTLTEQRIKNIPGVLYYTEVIQENVMLKYQEKQHIAILKGVGDDFPKMTKIDSLVFLGSPLLKDGDLNYALIGNGVAYELNINIGDLLSPLSVYVPRRGTRSVTDPLKAFNNRIIIPGGIFSVDIDYDEKYIIVPLDFARDLLDFKNEVTAIEIGIDKKFNVKLVSDKLKNILGSGYVVKNRFEQQEFLYKIMKSEKWAIFLILSFILVIAVFNIIGILTMLVLEKKRDISVIWALGGDNYLFRKIFFIQGVFITLIGALSGIVIGGIICWLQKTFGFISMHSADAFVVESYPVTIQGFDFVLVFFTVIFIGIIASYFPIRKISVSKFHQND
ncbi:MAG: ABC transporter permease [Bacteroidales bacterium]|nr:ABC transporter permease [Bacteroidales bacterium]